MKVMQCSSPATSSRVLELLADLDWPNSRVADVGAGRGYFSRRMGGHIHPISPYSLAYGALRAGLVEPRLISDRRKKSAVFWAGVLSPLLLAGRIAQGRRLARKKPEILADNRALIAAQESFELLTDRTAVVVARKSGPLHSGVA